LSDLESIDRRLDVLEAENRALRSKIVQLESGGIQKKIPQAPVEKRGVSVSFPTPPPVIDLPKASDLVILRDICRNAYPALCDSSGYKESHRFDKATKAECDQVWLDMFANSILAISNLYFLPKPDKRWAVSHHVDLCNDTLIRIGRRVDELRGPPLWRLLS
jgi:hypothetical protein